MKTNPENEVWLNRQQAAYLAGLSVERFDAAIRPQITGSENVRKSGRNLLLNGRAVVDAITRHRAETATADPLLSGNGDSPNLERYRAARAGIAEAELAVIHRSHVSIDSLANMLGRFAGCFRRAGEVLQRRFGNEAAEVVDESVSEAESLIQKELNGRGVGTI